MMEKIKVGIIGIGQRGKAVFKDILDIENVKVTAVCDSYDDRIEWASDFTFEKKGYRPILCTKNYKELISSSDVDVVMIFAAWEVHIPMSIEAMKAHKPVGVDVAGAYSVEQCWDLIRAYEETNTPIMMLENCCYGQRELMLLNMIEKGFFGEIVQIDGAYCHDLRREIADGIKNRHYRQRNYKNRNGENYPTHELGPIAQMLGINRGNRMVSLSSFSTKSVGLKDFIQKQRSDDETLKNITFTQGDIITTVIKCAHGEVIKLSLDTTLPRNYSRDLCIHGTEAFYNEQNEVLYRDGDVPENLVFKMDKKDLWNSFEKYRDEYEHPIWIKYLSDGVREGHGGMDWLVIKAFFDALKENKPMPIDVYDMATWMAITPLSERSIQLGSIPVEIPDFTNGKWVLRDEI